MRKAKKALATMLVAAQIFTLVPSNMVSVKAAGGDNGSVDFTITKDDLGYSSYVSYYRQGCEDIKVPVTDLDEEKHPNEIPVTIVYNYMDRSTVTGYEDPSGVSETIWIPTDGSSSSDTIKKKLEIKNPLDDRSSAIQNVKLFYVYDSDTSNKRDFSSGTFIYSNSDKAGSYHSGFGTIKYSPTCEDYHGKGDITKSVDLELPGVASFVDDYDKTAWVIEVNIRDEAEYNYYKMIYNNEEDYRSDKNGIKEKVGTKWWLWGNYYYATYATSKYTDDYDYKAGSISKDVNTVPMSTGYDYKNSLKGVKMDKLSYDIYCPCVYKMEKEIATDTLKIKKPFSSSTEEVKTTLSVCNYNTKTGECTPSYKMKVAGSDEEIVGSGDTWGRYASTDGYFFNISYKDEEIPCKVYYTYTLDKFLNTSDTKVRYTFDYSEDKTSITAHKVSENSYETRLVRSKTVKVPVEITYGYKMKTDDYKYITKTYDVDIPYTMVDDDHFRFDDGRINGKDGGVHIDVSEQLSKLSDMVGNSRFTPVNDIKNGSSLGTVFGICSRGIQNAANGFEADYNPSDGLEKVQFNNKYMSISSDTYNLIHPSGDYNYRDWTQYGHDDGVDTGGDPSHIFHFSIGAGRYEYLDGDLVDSDDEISTYPISDLETLSKSKIVFYVPVTSKKQEVEVKYYIDDGTHIDAVGSSSDALNFKDEFGKQISFDVPNISDSYNGRTVQGVSYYQEFLTPNSGDDRYFHFTDKNKQLNIGDYVDGTMVTLDDRSTLKNNLDFHYSKYYKSDAYNASGTGRMSVVIRVKPLSVRVNIYNVKFDKSNDEIQNMSDDEIKKYYQTASKIFSYDGVLAYYNKTYSYSLALKEFSKDVAIGTVSVWGNASTGSDGLVMKDYSDDDYKCFAVTSNEGTKSGKAPSYYTSHYIYEYEDSYRSVPMVSYWSDKLENKELNVYFLYCKKTSVDKELKVFDDYYDEDGSKIISSSQRGSDEVAKCLETKDGVISYDVKALETENERDYEVEQAEFTGELVEDKEIHFRYIKKPKFTITVKDELYDEDGSTVTDTVVRCTDKVSKNSSYIYLAQDIKGYTVVGESSYSGLATGDIEIVFTYKKNHEEKPKTTYKIKVEDVFYNNDGSLEVKREVRKIDALEEGTKYSYSAINKEGYKVSGDETISGVATKDTTVSFIYFAENEFIAKVCGYLYDANNKPIKNAVIELHSTPRTYVTDEDGYFEFNSVPLEMHTLTAKVDGVEAYKMNLNLNKTKVDTSVSTIADNFSVGSDSKFTSKSLVVTVKANECLRHTHSHKTEVINEADCTHSGYYNDIEYCPNCNMEWSKTTVYNEALGHIWRDEDWKLVTDVTDDLLSGAENSVNYTGSEMVYRRDCFRAGDAYELKVVGSVSTEKPVVVPTKEPIPTATASPTIKPTEVPTIEPTVSPSIIPTVEPTATVSPAPTKQPTASHIPIVTAKPTQEPIPTATAKPTEEPVATVRPTKKPKTKYYMVTVIDNYYDSASVLLKSVVREQRRVKAGTWYSYSALENKGYSIVGKSTYSGRATKNIVVGFRYKKDTNKIKYRLKVIDEYRNSNDEVISSNVRVNKKVNRGSDYYYKALKVGGYIIDGATSYRGIISHDLVLKFVYKRGNIKRKTAKFSVLVIDKYIVKSTTTKSTSVFGGFTSNAFSTKTGDKVTYTVSRVVRLKDTYVAGATYDYKALDIAGFQLDGKNRYKGVVSKNMVLQFVYIQDGINPNDVKDYGDEPEAVIAWSDEPKTGDNSRSQLPYIPVMLFAGAVVVAKRRRKR